MLLGRATERARIERLLDDARRGRGGALVIRGDPGIGKTSLLRYAVDLAEAMTVVEAVGAESEADLDFSSLLQLCRPLVSGLDALPEHQASRLRGALGLGRTPPGDRFVIGAATLGLLAHVAESRPLLVVVDDAQWLDSASRDALGFAARRLSADPIAFLFAARDAVSFADGFDELHLAGLELADAGALLRSVTGEELPSDVVERLHGATAGNPLGLVELPGALTPEQLAGSVSLAEPLPVGARVERAYAETVARLPERAQKALVVVALAGPENTAVVADALRGLGLDADDLGPAEERGLVSPTGAAYAFRHPLARSAVAQWVPAPLRRAVHRAIAEAMPDGESPERRAVHLAAATVVADERVAAQVADAAVAARRRGRMRAAAESFERAATLTPDPAARSERIAAAAQAAWDAGTVEGARRLVEEGLGGPVSARARGELTRLRGRVELQSGTADRARALFLEGADAFEAIDETETVTTLGLAVFASHFQGRIGEALDVSRRARSLVSDDRSGLRLQADYLLGRSLLLAGELDAGTGVLERVLEGLQSLDGTERRVIARTASALAVLERGPEALERAREATRHARLEGPMALVYGLTLSAEVDLRHGSWRRARAAAEEGRALARELGQPNIAAHLLLTIARIGAARGDEDGCRSAAGQALEELERAGMRAPMEHARCSLGLLELGLDRPERAVEELAGSSHRVAEMGLCDRDILPDPDLVESLARMGRIDEAADRLDAWLERGGEATTRMGAGLASRSRGLVADEGSFEAHFRQALERQSEATDPFGEARTRLCLGERLRRTGHRVDARGELKAALEAFERLEAEPWIARARRELRATGERLGRRSAVPGDELTAQELQVALQVADGRTNREAAAALFLSPKTVEFHLARVYRKLDVSSRVELIRRFAADEGASRLPVDASVATPGA